VKATVVALKSLRSPDQVAELRGLSVKEVLGLEPIGGRTDGASPADEAPAAEEARP
jgi:small subunit ribosomal protein S5